MFIGGPGSWWDLKGPLQGDWGQWRPWPIRLTPCLFGNPVSCHAACEQRGWCPVLPDTLALPHSCSPWKAGSWNSSSSSSKYHYRLPCKVLQVVHCTILGNNRHLRALRDLYIYYKKFSAYEGYIDQRKWHVYWICTNRLPVGCSLIEQGSILPVGCIVVFSQHPSLTYDPKKGYPPNSILLFLLMARTLPLL